MSIIAEYKALEAQIAEQQKRLEALKGDEKLKRDIEFETKLRGLLTEYSYSLRNVIALPSHNLAGNRTLDTENKLPFIWAKFKALVGFWPICRGIY